MRRALALPYAFVLMNWAAVVGFVYFISGRKDVWLSNKFAHSHKPYR
jgi:hypothetical protein